MAEPGGVSAAAYSTIEATSWFSVSFSVDVSIALTASATKLVISYSSVVPGSGAAGGASVVSAAAGDTAFPSLSTEPLANGVDLVLDLDTDLVREAATSVEPGGPLTGKDPPLELEKLDLLNTLIDSYLPDPGTPITGRPFC